MDLRLSPEQDQLRDATRRILAARLERLVAHLPEPPSYDPEQALADARALGWLSLGLPAEAGGAGGFVELALVHEELGRGLAPSLMTTLGLAGRLVLHTADDTAEPLTALADGRLLATPCLNAGTVTLTEDGGGLRLDGRAEHVVDTAAVDELLVVVRNAGTRTLDLVRVPVAAGGVGLTAEETFSDIATATVELDGVVDGVVIGRDIAAGLHRYRPEAWALAAARMVGGGRAVLERTVDYVAGREQFGRPIGTFQAVQHQLADVATGLDGAGLAAAQAATAIDAGAADVERLASIAVLTAREAFAAATLAAHQLHGGMGFVLDSPLHLWSARAVADPAAPAAQRQVLDLLADSLSLQATT